MDIYSPFIQAVSLLCRTPKRHITITAFFVSMVSFACAIHAETPTQTFTQITTGWSHTCGITAETGVKCWGDNRFYQLGDGTNINKPYPVTVAGLGHGVVAISAGTMHTCALLDSGKVKCWGLGGRQGDGTNHQQGGAVEVKGLRDVTSISTGDSHTCAVTKSGEAKCWGDNYNNKLGAGPDQNGLEPLTVMGITEKVTAVSVGMFHSCALTESNVYCWGDNYYGQLGNKSKTNSSAPVAVVGLAKDIKTITAGDFHTCATTTGGQVQCWGYNKFGQLGDGTNNPRITAVTVSGLPTNIHKVVSSQHSCALTTDGEVKCWGYNKFGQLGDNTTQNQSLPVSAKGQEKIKDLAINRTQTCVITQSGNIRCWGKDDSSQVGDTKPTLDTKPVM